MANARKKLEGKSLGMAIALNDVSQSHIGFDRSARGGAHPTHQAM